MEHSAKTSPGVYGLMAEFDTPEALLAGARLARDAGYKKMDAYSPMPVEGLSEALGNRDKIMPALMLCGGITGGLSGYFMQWYANTQSYPLNIGGKPFHSWPQFIVPTFEMTILFTALTGVFGMLIINGLPQPYHPVFNVPEFESASQDGFFLCIESRDTKFDLQHTRGFMENLGATRVREVEP